MKKVLRSIITWSLVLCLLVPTFPAFAAEEPTGETEIASPEESETFKEESPSEEDPSEPADLPSTEEPSEPEDPSVTDEPSEPEEPSEPSEPADPAERPEEDPSDPEPAADPEPTEDPELQEIAAPVLKSVEATAWNKIVVAWDDGWDRTRCKIYLHPVCDRCGRKSEGSGEDDVGNAETGRYVLEKRRVRRL